MQPVIYYGVDQKWHQANEDTSLSASGYSRLVETDGSVVSMQPGGGYGKAATEGTRPSGTSGPWEQGKQDGSFRIYTTGDGSESYPVMVLAR